MSYDTEQKAMLTKVEDVRKNPHNGLNGAELEDILVKFLENYLQDPSLGVSRGLVMDSIGNTSKEIDVIIYHKPSLFYLKRYDTYSVFPVENVVAAISVKASISGYSKLVTGQTSHFENLISIKRLVKVISGQSVYTPITAAFTYDLESSIGDVVTKINKFLMENDPDFWYSNDGQYRFDYVQENGSNRVQIKLPQFVYPEMFCFLNKGVILTNPGFFQRINADDRRKINSVTLLADESQILRNFLKWLNIMIQDRRFRSYSANIDLYENNTHIL